MSLAESQIQKSNPATVNKVSITAPIQWISKGLSDLKTTKLISLAYGLSFAVIGLFLVFMGKNNPVWSAAFTTAFLLIGPFLAIGLYDLSRQIEEGQKPSLLNSVNVIRKNLVSLGFFSIILGIILMLWLRIAALVAGH